MQIPSTGGRRSGGIRRAAATLALLALLAAPAAALAAGGSFAAKLKAPNHAPIAGSYWTITLSVTKGSAKLSGNVNYEFLSGGQVVSHQRGHAFTHGAFRDRLCFPPLAVGQRLKLGIIVTTTAGTKTLYWAVTPTKGKVTSPCKASL